MDLNTDELWWDHSLLLEHFATVLLEAADKHRKLGQCLGSAEVAQQMEDCAWEMLSVDSEWGEEQERVDNFCEMIKRNVRNWWD